MMKFLMNQEIWVRALKFIPENDRNLRRILGGKKL